MKHKHRFRIAVALGVTLLGTGVGQTARADEALATSGTYTLTQELVNTDLAYTEWKAHHSLTSEERRELTAINLTQFRRSPKLFVQATQSEGSELNRVSKLAPVFQQQVRYNALWSAFGVYKNNEFCTAEEFAAYQGIYRRYTQPVIVPLPRPFGNPETAMILLEDIQAGYEATRFFADKMGVSAPSREQFGELVKQVSAMRCEVGSPGRSFLAYMGNMRSRWLAMQQNIKVSKDGGASAFELEQVPANKRNDPIQLALAVPPTFDFTLAVYAVQYDSDGRMFPVDVQIARQRQALANRAAFLNAALNVSRPVR